MMIEPTETESKETLDYFIDAMIQIAEEAKNDPDKVLEAPHSTIIDRLDETTQRKPVLKFDNHMKKKNNLNFDPVTNLIDYRVFPILNLSEIFYVYSILENVSK